MVMLKGDIYGEGILNIGLWTLYFMCRAIIKYGVPRILLLFNIKTIKILVEAVLLKSNVLRGWQLQNGNAEK